MRATRPARLLVRSIGFLDRFWGPLVVAVVVALEVFVFGPRGMVEWMIGAGIVGAALLVAWIVSDSSF